LISGISSVGLVQIIVVIEKPTLMALMAQFTQMTF
jgi:hypothetical protein